MRLNPEGHILIEAYEDGEPKPIAVIDPQGFDPEKLDRAAFVVACQSHTWSRAQWEKPNPLGNFSWNRKESAYRGALAILSAYEGR